MASPAITAFIGGHEGYVSKWYLDPTGTPTIGYGFTWASRVFRDWWTARYGRKLRRGDTISQRDALEVLSLMIDREYAPPVLRKLGHLKQHVTDPATSMVFNAGTGALEWSWADMLARGDIKSGCERWRTTATTSKGRRLPGLVRRRDEEADIAEFQTWPSWLSVPDDIQKSPPATHVPGENIRQAQVWLEQLGYSPGPADGILGPRTIQATRRFQQDHGTLVVDGIIGPATLDALQRSIDLRSRAGGVAAGGGAAVGTGAVEEGTDATGALPGVENMDWLGPVFIWGGLAILVVGLVWLAWRYQDEINAVLRRL